mmetsp:Transcript_1726/g.3058  ORF Transcript_1726/g.3058 Transcript_1726/m.3058 type:complete len:80 (+) Transcript_1726:778-1017(+)
MFDHVISSQDKEYLKLTKNLAEDKMVQMQLDYPKKWMVFAVGVILGMILGVQVPNIYNSLNSSLYKRVALEKIMSDYLG